MDMNARHVEAGGSAVFIKEATFFIVYSRRNKVLLTWINDPLGSKKSGGP
jgi:hypothetical protein